MHERLLREKMRRHTSLEKLVELAIGEWLDGQEPSRHPLEDKLHAILGSGDQLAVDAVTADINFFFERRKRTEDQSEINL